MTDCDRFHHLPNIPGFKARGWVFEKGPTPIRDRVLLDEKGNRILRIRARLNDKGIWEVINERHPDWLHVRIH